MSTLDDLSIEIRELSIEIQGLTNGPYKRDKVRNLKKLLKQKYKLMKESRRTVTGGKRNEHSYKS